MKDNIYDTVKLIECALSVLRSNVSEDTKSAADILIYNLLVDVTPEPETSKTDSSNSLFTVPCTPATSYGLLVSPSIGTGVTNFNTTVQPSDVYC